MELVNVTYQDVKEFMLGLSIEERYYYDLLWDALASEAVFIQGYWDNRRLIGIAGIYRKFLIAYSSFYLIKAVYWGKGTALRMTVGIMQWARIHYIPCIITQYHSKNVRMSKALRKSGIQKDMQIGEFTYSVSLTTKWALLLKYILLGLIWGYCMIRGRK